MFITFGLSLTPCSSDQPQCQGFALSANMNNVSFRFPTNISLLEAHFNGVEGVYTRDFPDRPPLVFDYTNPNVNAVGTSLQLSEKGTKVKRLRFNSTVEIVLQNTAVLASDSHPIHLHGFNFYVLAQGFGNYNHTEAVEKFNLWNPQVRNTIAVPVGGWAVIRFWADNPGIWFMHCHLDVHLPLGLGMAFEVENGPTPSSTLPPPPPDLPLC
ncbi:laccase-7-like [Phalaenopsis equestris]|nr:laccase-7-like [Phalaenopsis equestris]